VADSRLSQSARVPFLPDRDLRNAPTWQTRAVAQQPVAAQLCGISLDRTNAATFVMSGMLGGLAGAMIGSSAELLSNLLPLQLTVKGLIVTVIGGLIFSTILTLVLVPAFFSIALDIEDWIGSRFHKLMGEPDTSERGDPVPAE
jgi:branched-subunit amino acid ABC-type transport system permease component